MHDHYVTYRPGNRGRSSWPSSSDAVRVLCTASGDEYCKAGALRSAAQTVQCEGAAAECPELFNPFGILGGGYFVGTYSNRQDTQPAVSGLLVATQVPCQRFPSVSNLL